jgi:(S)-ureidoglycine-glyoxylate aminotransferase
MLDLHHTLFIEKRIIMTPGPVEADPRVLRAMTNPIIHLFDPEFTQLMDDTMSMTRKMFNTSNKNAFAINGSARAGIEAHLVLSSKKVQKSIFPLQEDSGIFLRKSQNELKVM